MQISQGKNGYQHLFRNYHVKFKKRRFYINKTPKGENLQHNENHKSKGIHEIRVR